MTRRKISTYPAPQVATIHAVDTSTAAPSRPARAPRERDSWGNDGGYGGGNSYGGSRGGYDSYGDSDSGETVDGTVKWFNVSKGFGFIAPSTGCKDIFVHIRALERSGINGLDDGAQVRVTIRQGAKCPEQCLALFPLLLLSSYVTRHIHELRGKDLMCWCPLDQPCHADVLLELANK